MTGETMVVGRCANSPDRGPSLVRGTIMANDTCSVDGCESSDIAARGMCNKHYLRWWKANRSPRLTTSERFEAKVSRSHGVGGCWEWTACLDHNGYGIFWNGERRVPAHRYSYEAAVGPIPDGLQIDHLCRVRHCVNPAHLEAVTPKVNTLRGVGPSATAARKTHCPLGHPYSGANVYVTAAGARQCRACWKIRRDRSLSIRQATAVLNERTKP